MEEILNSQMLSAFKQGDEKAFRKVFDLYYTGLVQFIHNLIDSRQEAEDITLKAFQSLFSRCRTFETEINIKAFLYICGRNAGLNYIKAKQYEKGQLIRYAGDISINGFPEFEFKVKQGLIAVVHKAIDELPAECRKVFKMLYYEELEPGEVATLLNITVSTVYNQKSRALSALRMKFVENTIMVLCILAPMSLI